jgi:hypothetical protein
MCFFALSFRKRHRRKKGVEWGGDYGYRDAIREWVLVSL